MRSTILLLLAVSLTVVFAYVRLTQLMNETKKRGFNEMYEFERKKNLWFCVLVGAIVAGVLGAIALAVFQQL
jgi:undecaprenyl pyrophosphate phosphatase UppP